MRTALRETSFHTASFVLRLPLRVARATLFFVTAIALAGLLCGSAGAVLALPFAVWFGWDAIATGAGLALVPLYVGLGPAHPEEFVRDCAAVVRELGRAALKRRCGTERRSR